MTVGGDKIDYPRDANSPAVSILNDNILTNSKTSDAHKVTEYLGLGIENSTW